MIYDEAMCVISIYSLFEENKIYYPQIVLHDCSYECEFNDSDSEY